MGFNNHYIQEAVGFFRGLWLLWNNEDVSIKESRKEEKISFIYASPRNSERKTLWESLQNLRVTASDAWITISDFNSYLGEEEKTGGAEPNWNSMRDFQNCLDECNLVDIGFKGPKFTRKRGRLYERLDRACSNERWNTCFPNREIINNAGIGQPYGDQLARNSKSRLRSGIMIQAKNLTEESTPSMLESKFQRSRCNWLMFGDKNLKYFHSTIVARRRSNRIDSLKDENDDWIGEPNQLSNMISNYFEKLYCEDKVSKPKLPVKGAFPSLRSQSLRMMCAIPTLEEIRSVVFHFGPFKAPGVDGLNALFFQAQWNKVGQTVCKVVKEAFIILEV
ncbi:uncharacterized protein LOC133312080 [Gastrolobium bilobum]|uniref:uncharacterized protein LOC133312080 n=1 Tax=Gastrolobium bilobum TaxID=150636 RepID=UPI002AAFB93F|nr:uncharacterized protein LOC133312080 [Gastrolobium bilobum]